MEYRCGATSSSIRTKRRFKKNILNYFVLTLVQRYFPVNFPAFFKIRISSTISSKSGHADIYAALSFYAQALTDFQSNFSASPAVSTSSTRLLLLFKVSLLSYNPTPVCVCDQTTHLSVMRSLVFKARLSDVSLDSARVCVCVCYSVFISRWRNSLLINSLPVSFRLLSKRTALRSDAPESPQA